MPAPRHQLCQGAFHPAQILESRADFREPRGCDAANLGAIGAVLERQQPFDLVQRKAKLLCTLDEADTGDMAAVVVAKTARLVLGLRNQTPPLIVANGLHADRSGLRRLCYGECRCVHFIALDSVPRYGL